MQYLSDAVALGGTVFNVWPVPLVPVAVMANSALHVHDGIFTNDAAEDSGAEGGAGTVVVQDCLKSTSSLFPTSTSKRKHCNQH